MYGEMGAASNTMLFSDRPADVNSLLAQAATVLGQTAGGSRLGLPPPPPTTPAASG